MVSCPQCNTPLQTLECPHCDATSGFWDMLRAVTVAHIRQCSDMGQFFGLKGNRYALETDEGPLGWVAEQKRSALDVMFGSFRARGFTLFDERRAPVLRMLQPFRFILRRIDVTRPDGEPLGAIQQRFSFFVRRLDILGPSEQLLMSVSSSALQPWTFPFTKQGKEVAVIEKRWTSLLSEAFTDRDHFRVRFSEPTLTDVERGLLLAAGLFIDLRYFERKGVGSHTTSSSS